MKIKMRIGAVLLIMVLTITAMPLTAFATTPAAQQPPLTYEQRVAALQTNYSVTYRKNFSEAWTDGEKEGSLQSVEMATQIIGSRAMHAIARPWVNQNGSFKIQNIIMSVGYAFIENGVISLAVTPEVGVSAGNIGTMYYKGITYLTEDSQKYYVKMNADVLIHEIGHAYDIGILQNNGRSVIAKINGIYNQTDQYNQNRYANHQSFQNSAEDFATTFEFMLTHDVKFTEIQKVSPQTGLMVSRNLTNNDILYKKCEAIYEMMLRDFGVESAAVIRAAWFLDKQLPAQ